MRNIVQRCAMVMVVAVKAVAGNKYGDKFDDKFCDLILINNISLNITHPFQEIISKKMMMMMEVVAVKAVASTRQRLKEVTTPVCCLPRWWVPQIPLLLLLHLNHQCSCASMQLC